MSSSKGKKDNDGQTADGGRRTTYKQQSKLISRLERAENTKKNKNKTSEKTFRHTIFVTQAYVTRVTTFATFAFATSSDIKLAFVTVTRALIKLALPQRICHTSVCKLSLYPRNFRHNNICFLYKEPLSQYLQHSSTLVTHQIAYILP
jgi:hypothetical protein